MPGFIMISGCSIQFSRPQLHRNKHPHSPAIYVPPHHPCPKEPYNKKRHVFQQRFGGIASQAGLYSQNIPQKPEGAQWHGIDKRRSLNDIHGIRDEHRRAGHVHSPVQKPVGIEVEALPVIARVFAQRVLLTQPLAGAEEQGEKKRRKPGDSCNARISETLKMRKARMAADVLFTAPEGIGRNFFWGWSESFDASKMSLRMYVALEARQNA